MLACIFREELTVCRAQAGPELSFQPQTLECQELWVCATTLDLKCFGLFLWYQGLKPKPVLAKKSSVHALYPQPKNAHATEAIADIKRGLRNKDKPLPSLPFCII